MPPLKPLHSDCSLIESKLKLYGKLSDQELTDSLKLGQPGALKTQPDGTIVDGQHRIKILRDRGVDVDSLPREIIPKGPIPIRFRNRAAAGQEESMRTELYWVQGPWLGRLAVTPRPRGGDWLEDDVRSCRKAGVDEVLSLLTSDEVAEFDLSGEAKLCRANGIQFNSFPIADRGVQLSKEVAAALAIVGSLVNSLAEGKNVAVHCRQGIGRAGLIAICLLIQSGCDPQTAIQRVSEARGCAVPETPEQRRWIVEFAHSPVGVVS